MKRLVGIVVVAGLLVAADDVKKKLEGTWHPAAYEHGGKSIPADDIKEWSLVITGDKYRMTIGDSTEEGTFTIDSSKKPATVDCTPTNGDNQGKTRKGIYRLKGDEAKVCFAAIGHDERPAEFRSPEGSDNYLWTFRREKK